MPARLRIEQLADPHTFREHDRSLISSDPLSFSDRLSYQERLDEARKRTGLVDAVVTGTCQISGRPAVLVVFDFEFLGGSMGSVVGEKITRAFEHARKERIPLISVANSGGARMQEGMLSLVQMAKTAAAANRLRQTGVPFISVLANPTTGGVYASFASLGDIILAEPRALIGFAGPRVAEQLLGRKLPEGSHSAEFLLQHGMIDRVVSRVQMRELVAVLLDLFARPYRLTANKGDQGPATYDDRTPETAWQTVQLARHSRRPTSLDYICRMIGNFVELHGDRRFGDDPAIVAGIGEFSGQAVAVIGQERGHSDDAEFRNQGRARPEGYRKAVRVMELAERFHLPLLTFIDTPGAYPGLESEERGLALSIAECLAAMSGLKTPVLATVIGEGGSGGALALGVGDRIFMLEHAIYSVIAPEGAAAIIHRDAGRAEELTPSLKLTAPDCRHLNVIDGVVPEPPGGAHHDHDGAARLLRRFLLRELIALQKQDPRRLVKRRYKKFRRMGETDRYLRVAIAREVSQVQEALAQKFGEIREHFPGRGSPNDQERPQPAESAAPEQEKTSA